MTAVCGGGPSGPKASSDSVVYVAGSELAAFIGAIFEVPPWISIAAYAGAQSYVTATLCATDPPAMPTFTAADIVDILNPNPLRDSPANHKLDTVLEIAAWYLLCECTGGSTPTPVAPPVYPTGAPAINPPNGTPQKIDPCYTKTNTSPQAYGFQGVINTGPHSGSSNCNFQDGNSIIASCLNASAGRWTMTVNADGTVNGPMSASINWYSGPPSGSLIRTDGGTSVPVGATHVYGPFTPPTGWGLCEVFINPLGTAGQNNSISMTTDVWCPGQSPNNPQSDCCPPDPALQAELDSIISMLGAIYASLPTPINSYASASVHAGLTGDGTLTLADAPIAIRIDITTDQPTLGENVTVPPYLFDRGFIVPVVNTAPIAGQTRLVYNPQMYVLPALTEQIGYSLAPGVVIQVTELTAGP